MLPRYKALLMRSWENDALGERRKIRQYQGTMALISSATICRACCLEAKNLCTLDLWQRFLEASYI